MAKETVEALVEGGKASAAPPLGPALGPLKVNIGEVVAAINQKTSDFKGMKVPIKVIVDTETKEFDIEIGTPPASQLIKKELNLKSGSGIPNKDKVANMAMEQVVKVAKMKLSSLFVRNMKGACKTIIGSANSMGILVEGKSALEINQEIDEGKWDEIIMKEKTEIPQEKISQLKEQLETIRKKFSKELASIKAVSDAKKEEADKKEEGKEAAATKEKPAEKK